MTFHKSTIKRKAYIQRCLIFVLAGLFLSTVSPTVIHAISTEYFADDGADTNVNTCEVLDWSAGNRVCSDHDAYLAASNKDTVPLGLTTLRIYFSIPNPAPASMTFNMTGSNFCPGFFGKDTGNPNGRDMLDGGYYDSSHNGAGLLSGGDIVTDFLLVNANGSITNLTNAYGTIGRYRTADKYCKNGQPNQNQAITVSVSSMRYQAGLASNIRFVELVAQPHVTNPNTTGNVYQNGNGGAATIGNGIMVKTDCSDSSVGRCDGIINEFSVNGPSYVTTSSQNNGSRTYNVTIQNGNPDLDDIVGKIQPAQHQSYLARFGADCTIPDSGLPTSGVEKQINLYDVDHSGYAPENSKGYYRADQIRVQVIRTDQNNQKWMLDPSFWSTVTTTAGAPTNAAGNWVKTNKTKPAYLTDGIVVPSGNGITRYLTFGAYPYDKYEFYLMDVRTDLVNQFGLPFDGIYYAISCQKGTVNPTPKIVDSSGNQPSSFEVGDTFKSLGQLTNSTNIASSAYAGWITWYDSGDSNYNAADPNDQFLYEKDSLSTCTPPNPVTNPPPVGCNRRTVPGDNPLTPSVDESITNVDAARSSYDGTINGAYKFICSRVYNVISADPTTTKVSQTEQTTCIPIQRSPYFQVQNGDANAAASLSTSSGCPGNTTSPISAFNRDIAPNYTGSGAEIAAFAAGAINGFTSGASPKPKALSFANTAGAGNLTYGGGFQGTYCIPNYWADATDTAAAQTTVTSATNTLITNGDVYISGNPLQQQLNTDILPFGLANIPLRWIVANNIYIDQNVHYLEGNYIAKGRIYTCATGFGSPVGAAPGSLNDLIGGCNKSLEVKGSFVAGLGVKLQRTYGSLNDPTPAENFVYGPDTWIQAIRPDDDVPNSVKGVLGKYDSITLLPPVL